MPKMPPRNARERRYLNLRRAAFAVMPVAAATGALLINWASIWQWQYALGLAGVAVISLGGRWVDQRWRETWRIVDAAPAAGDGRCHTSLLDRLLGRLLDRISPGAPEDPAAPHPRIERLVLYLALLVLLIGTVMYNTLNQFLAAFHRPGEAAYTTYDLTGPFLLPADRLAHFRAASDSWYRHANPAIGKALYASEHAPLAVLHHQLFVDTVLIVPAYGALLAILVVWLWRKVAQQHSHGARDATGRAEHALLTQGPMVLFVIWVALVADWAENSLTLVVMHLSWYGDAHWSLPGDDATWQVTLNVILGSVVLVKWACLALAIGYLAYVSAFLLLRSDPLMAVGRRRDVHAVVQGVLAVRVPLLIVVIFAVTAYNEQTQEVVRRWVDRRHALTALWSLCLGALVTVALAVCSWVLMAIRTPPASASPVLPWPLRLAPYRALWRNERHRAGLWWWVRWHRRDPGFAIVCALGVAALIFAVATRTFVAPVTYLFVAGGLAILSVPVVALRRPSGGTLTGLGLFPGLLAGAVPLIMCLATVSALIELTTDAALRQNQLGADGRPLFLLLAALALLLVAIVCFAVDVEKGIKRLLRVPAEGEWTGATRVAGTILAACLACWAVFATVLASDERVYPVAGGLGTLGVVLLALLFLLGIGTSVVVLADQLWHRSAPLFRMARLRYPPILTLLLIWSLITAGLPGTEDIHRARVVRLPATGPGTARTGVQLESAFDEWRQRRCINPGRPGTAPAAATPRPVVPLILLATSGGGIRAAAWTTYVVDALFGETPAIAAPPCGAGGTGRYRSDWLFAASGVSGGSVGLATYASRLTTVAAQGASPDRAAALGTADNDWVQQQLSADLLAPSLAWMLFAEFPWSFVRGGLHEDRARVLERAWERAWGQPESQPRFFEQYTRSHAGAAGSPEVPLLLLNATSVESGCRFVGTVLELNGRSTDEAPDRCRAPGTLNPKGVVGGSNDLADFLCTDQDMPLSTVAFLSARFPFVSPTGDLTQCAKDLTYRTYLVDGGYLEGSATATIGALWATLAPLVARHNQRADAPAYIMPVLIRIDNGYSEPAPPNTAPRPGQALAPALTYGRIIDGVEALSRQEAQLRFGDGLVLPESAGECVVSAQPRFAPFPLRAHPGPEAKLGWTLSDVAFTDLRDQYLHLNYDPAGTLNQPAPNSPAAIVDAWFAGIGVPSARCGQ